MSELDPFDREIISALQDNGRLTNVEVAEIVGLSHSSCSRRIARLERDGIITGYRALTDRLRLGLSVRAFCGIERTTMVDWDSLAAQLAQIDGVVSVFTMSGEADLMVEVVARDMQHFSEIILRQINMTKGVGATRSSFVMAEVKSLY